MNLRFLRPAVGVVLVWAAPHGYAAENTSAYPTRPVRLIVANTTGTSVDTLARVVAAKMAEDLGQQIVADNRAGAGGIIGAEIASVGSGRLHAPRELDWNADDRPADLSQACLRSGQELRGD